MNSPTSGPSANCSKLLASDRTNFFDLAAANYGFFSILSFYEFLALQKSGSGVILCVKLRCETVSFHDISSPGNEVKLRFFSQCQIRVISNTIKGNERLS